MNWKLIILRIILNGLAIALTALLLPGVVVPEPTLVRFLVLGLVIGLLNAFIKPLIQVLTISFLFVTYGFVMVFVNAVMLLLLELVLPPTFLSVQGLGAALLGGVLVATFSAILENLVGLSRPVLDRALPAEMGASPALRIEQPRYQELMAELQAAKKEIHHGQTHQS